ncbi:MAG TPA: hypothetical protein VMG12_29865 [Polyangiaceae bacterium]|nr:hypothetical protein [Polyangiaceae bacterium]
MESRSASVRFAVVSALGLLLNDACSDSSEGASNGAPPSTSSPGMPSAPAPAGDMGGGDVPAGTNGMTSPGNTTETPAPSLPLEPTEGTEPMGSETEPMGPDQPTDVDVPTPVPVGPCKAVGWATRVGRSGGAFDVTGGGDVAAVTVDNFGDLQQLASGAEPRVIYIDGPVGSGFRDGAGDRLDIGSNKTIVGVRPGTVLNAAVLISGDDSSNIILRNIVINGPGSDDQQSWDNINITSGAHNIWVDHCEFWDGQDGNADVIRGADNVTFTYNVFGYRGNGLHNLSNLVASSDNEPESEGKLNITLMLNHFRGADQRTPRCRYGDIHVVNNLFTTEGLNSSMGTSPGVQCRILTENNHFIGISEPIHEREGGINELRGENIFEGTRGNTAGYGGVAFEPPYAYADILLPASEVRARLDGRVGATLASPTQCDE